MSIPDRANAELMWGIIAVELLIVVLWWPRRPWPRRPWPPRPRPRPDGDPR